MILKVNGLKYTHPLLEVADALIVDATTDELYVSYPMGSDASKQKVFATGRKILLEVGFVSKKFRFVDDIHFTKRVIGGKRVPVVTVKLTYTGSWNNVRVRPIQ